MIQWTLDDWSKLLQLLYYIAVILGVPGALYHYFKTTKRERRDREYGTYNALDDKFIQYLELCLNNPDLDIFDIPDKQHVEKTDEQHKREQIAFTILFSLFERAYLMYFDHSESIRRQQWEGWELYIESFCRRSNFREAWQSSGATFDKEFEKYMKKTLAQTATLVE